VQLGQGRLGNCPGVVVEADQSIELVLAGRRSAQRAGNIPGEADQIALQPGVAFGPGPDRAASDALAGRAPANRPRIAAGARIGIGLEPAIAAQPRAQPSKRLIRARPAGEMDDPAGTGSAAAGNGSAGARLAGCSAPPRAFIRRRASKKSSENSMGRPHESRQGPTIRQEEAL
jgi:hypothetical protein